MPTEDEASEPKTPSISSRTRSRIRQDPIVTAPDLDLTVQDVDDILQNSSSSKADSEVSDLEEDIDSNTQQYNPRTLPFSTTTTTTAATAMAPSSPFDADLLYIFTDVLNIDMTQKPLHMIPAGVLHWGITEWTDFYVLETSIIEKFTYPSSGNTRTNVPPHLVNEF